MKKRILITRVREYSNIEPSITIEAVLDNDEQAASLVQKLDDISAAKKEKDVHHEIYRN